VNRKIYPMPGVVQFPPPPSTVMDRVTDRVRDSVRDRDMGRVMDRVRLRGLAIAAPSYSGPYNRFHWGRKLEFAPLPTPISDPNPIPDRDPNPNPIPNPVLVELTRRLTEID